MRIGHALDGRRSLPKRYNGAPGQGWRAGRTAVAAGAAGVLVLGAASLFATPAALAQAACTITDGPSLQDAVDEAAEGDGNVILCQNISYTNPEGGSSGNPGLIIPEGKTITLYLAGKNLSLTGSEEGAGIRTTGATLTINGPGNLTATGGSGSGSSDGGGSGIGGDGDGYKGGTVTINGGDVTATGGNASTFGSVDPDDGGGGSGIGGGGGDDSLHDEGAGGTVTINGGTVTARGGNSVGDDRSPGPGIGGTAIGGGGFDYVPERGGAGGTVTIGRDAVVNATSAPGANAVVGSNGRLPHGAVSNSGMLTLTGDSQTNYGKLTNTSTGLINLNTQMSGTEQVTNDGTIRLTDSGSVDYTQAHIKQHAFLVGYSPSPAASRVQALAAADEPSQVLAATFNDAQVPLPAPPDGDAWYSANSCDGQVVTASTDLPTAFGQKDVNPNNAFETDGMTLKPNVTLYAQVQQTVMFDANGGSPTPPTQTVASGCLATKPTTAPTQTNYTFNGWSSSKDGSSGPYDFAKPVTSDLTLYAQWTGGSVTPTSPTTPGSSGTIVVSDAPGTNGPGNANVSPASNGQPGLADTGVEVSTLLYTALSMLLIGILAVVLGRRRLRGTR